jgi:hypothetical protein
MLSGCDSHFGAKLRVDTVGSAKEATITTIDMSVEKVYEIFDSVTERHGINCLKKEKEVYIRECNLPWHKHVRIAKGNNDVFIFLSQSRPGWGPPSEEFINLYKDMLSTLQVSFGNKVVVQNNWE